MQVAALERRVLQDVEDVDSGRAATAEELAAGWARDIDVNARVGSRGGIVSRDVRWRERAARDESRFQKKTYMSP